MSFVVLVLASIILEAAVGYVRISNGLRISRSFATSSNAVNGAIAKYFELSVSTLKGISFHDLSADIQRCIDESCVKEGTVSIYSRHTTTAITINEMEGR